MLVFDRAADKVVTENKSDLEMVAELKLRLEGLVPQDPEDGITWLRDRLLEEMWGYAVVAFESAAEDLGALNQYDHEAAADELFLQVESMRYEHQVYQFLLDNPAIVMYRSASNELLWEDPEDGTLHDVFTDILGDEEDNE